MKYVNLGICTIILSLYIQFPCPGVRGSFPLDLSPSFPLYLDLVIGDVLEIQIFFTIFQLFFSPKYLRFNPSTSTYFI